MGPKILTVTTRDNKVASCVGGTAHNLPGLPHEECVSLFKKLAFASEAEVDKELMKIGEDIVKKCKGVPLAIRILGSFLFSKSDENEWLLVRDSSIWELPESQRSILPVLKFSYDHLPSHLKQCFVYCSIFPEDYEFEDRFLIPFWMAHGLLLQPSKKNQEPEDVGKKYIDELLSRGFFQNREENLPFGWTFKMHDLVRDLACSLGQEEFANITDSYKSISKSVNHWYCQADEIPADSTSNVVRSLIFSEANVLGCKTMVLNDFSKFKYLRFLRLNRGCNKVPDTIGDLKHLRYLDLSDCDRLRSLPDSICKLHNLQTLILGCPWLKELPKNIGELINLRYLWITTSQLKALPEWLPNLSSLRTLHIWDCPKLLCLPQGMERLTNLKQLIIVGCGELSRRCNEETGEDWPKIAHVPSIYIG